VGARDGGCCRTAARVETRRGTAAIGVDVGLLGR